MFVNSQPLSPGWFLCIRLLFIATFTHFPPCWLLHIRFSICLLTLNHFPPACFSTYIFYLLRPLSHFSLFWFLYIHFSICELSTTFPPAGFFIYVLLMQHSKHLLMISCSFVLCSMFPCDASCRCQLHVFSVCVWLSALFIGGNC